MEKLSPKEIVEGADSVLGGSVKAPKGFSKGKPDGLPEENPEGALTLPHSTVSAPKALS